MSASSSSFTELDWKSINTIRGLAVDMVQKANSGHPGMPLGMAPVAHVLFSRFMKFAPSNPHWISRDRFVLSNGHGCALLYTLLHLCGYKVSMKDLEAFRQIDSITPGHPERHMTEGVEVTTGPLGQGLTNAVGMAIASRHTAARFSKPGYEQLFDNYVYAFAGDGCLMEGVTSEACSLAGHLGLGNLICIYDDNKISIDGSTDVAFTENVGKRYEAYGWHVQHVEHGDNDLDAMEKAIENAKKVTDKPSIICLRTTIGYGSKNQGTHHVHGAPLQAEDYKNLKVKLGLPEANFTVSEEVSAQYAALVKKGEQALQEFNTLLAKYTTEFPEQAKLFNRLITGDVLPQDIDALLTKYTLRETNSATRKLSQQALNIFADAIPELIGGSADLAASNLTDLKNSTDFQKGKYEGRILRFGVREHAMGAICNGIASYGGYIPFCATFLNFVGYMWGAMRLSALSHHQVIYVMTHDSIGLGEDGPTHQPIEVVSLMRATPNFYVFRPADSNEVFGAYKQALLAKTTPSCICLTRQDLPKLTHSSVEKVAQGGYVVFNEEKKADLVFVATGSEVSLCIDTANKLEKENGIVARVVSIPCLELFAKQSAAYKQSVLLDGSVPVVSVEVLATLGWERFSHVQIGLDKFGTSGPYKQVFEKFGFVPSALSAKAVKIVQFFKQHPKRLYNLAEELTF